MEKSKKTGSQGRRPETRFWVWSEQWLLGSTRTELDNAERAIWMDFLCLASLKSGYIECYSRDQLANQLCISRKLLDKCIEKFLKFKKIRKKVKKSENKEVFVITKWKNYQPQYLWLTPSKSTRRTKKEEDKKDKKSDAYVDDIGEERRGEENGKEKRRGEESKPPKDNPSSPSPLPSAPTIKEEFLSELKNCKGYPFNEVEDSLLFDIAIQDYPGINFIRLVKRKVEWWWSHPDALDADPRKQLQDFFREESEFQERGGEPRRIGEIMSGLEDADHRNWIKRGLLGDPKKNV